jgi:hypothetical protein
MCGQNCQKALEELYISRGSFTSTLPVCGLNDQVCYHSWVRTTVPDLREVEELQWTLAMLTATVCA